MNLLDIVFLSVLLGFLLAGWYRGFLYTVCSIGAYVVSVALALLLTGIPANAVKNTESLYNMMLYYTEGAEKIGDVELSKTAISELSSEQIASVTGSSSLPYPLGKLIKTNIATEAFSEKEITTLGDYYNETIVCVIINILCFLALFFAIRLVLSFVLNGIDYAAVLPVLRHSDGLLGAGFGLVRGALAILAVMTLVPIVLTVLPFDFITDLVEESFFGPFFYRSNVMLALISGT